MECLRLRKPGRPESLDWPEMGKDYLRLRWEMMGNTNEQ